jgi:pimeloyl-ACP methyl ester carboxylesterase
MPFIATLVVAGGPSDSVAAVATFALIHGGGGSAWDWHLVAPALREHGHDAVAVDLPGEDESAGWEEYADAVVEAIGDRRGVMVVGHSLGGFTAPLGALAFPSTSSYSWRR